MTELEMQILNKFDETLEVHQNSLAISSSSLSLSYRDLDICSQHLSIEVSSKNSHQTKLVGICTEQSADFIIALLGILKAGYAWVYLDPGLPKNRLETLLEDSGIELVVSSVDYVELLSSLESPIDIAIIDTSVKDAGIASKKLIHIDNTFACVLYTSGSTGKPKGVIQTHKNWCHVVDKAVNTLAIGPEDRIAMLSPPGHVVGVAAVMMALMTGASLHIFDLPKRGFHELVEWIREQQITYFHTVPTVFRRLILASNNKDDFASVRMVAIGGELVTREDVELFRDKFSSNAVLRNSYGATEAVDTFQYLVNADTEFSGATVAIGVQGSSIDEMRLVTESGQPPKEGEPGEIYITSPFISLGYWNNPIATAAKFIEEKTDGTRTYKTGDWGFVDAQGQLNYVSRIDDQVKVRGHRVELNEIELALRSLLGIKDAAVKSFMSEESETQIAAYIVLDSEQAEETPNIRRLLAKKLPDYMIPAAIQTLTELPQNSAGKIDKVKLLNPFREVTKDFLHRVKWAESNIPHENDRQFCSEVIVLGGSTKLEPIYNKALSTLDCPFSIFPDFGFTDSSTHQELLDGRFDNGGTIIYQAPLHIETDSESDSKTKMEQIRRLLHSAIKIAIWVKAHKRKNVQFLVITQSTSDEQAALRGMVRSIWKDLGEMNIRLIEFDELDNKLFPSTLVNEIQSPINAELSISYREGKRYLMRLAVEQASKNRPIKFSTGSYIITGGLGALGLCLAEHLAILGAKKIVLIGRSSPNKEAYERISRISNKGISVETFAADVTDSQRIQEIVHSINTPELPLRGVFHLAGTYEFKLLQYFEWEAFERVLAPKIMGAVNLHEATKNLKLDCFVMASSTSAIFGFSGHAAYCAANSYLDNFSQTLYDSGVPALSVNFGTLAGGMAASESVQTWVGREGIHPMEIQNAVKYMFSCLEAAPLEKVMIADISWKKLLSSRPAIDRNILREVTSINEPSINKVSGLVLASLGQTELESIISNIWKKSLNLKNIPPNANLFDLGGNSMTLIELQVSLSDALDQQVSIADISDHPSISSLTTFLLTDTSEASRPSSLVKIREGSNVHFTVINSTREAKIVANYLDEDIGISSLNLFRLSSFARSEGYKELIPNLARLYADDLEANGFPKNIFLFGFCQDALLTVETAHCLIERGANVQGMFLLDSLFRDDVSNTLLERWTTIKEVGPINYCLFYLRRLPGAIKTRIRHGWKVIPRYIISENEKWMYDTYHSEVFSREPKESTIPIIHLITSQWKHKKTNAYQRIAKGEFIELPLVGTHHGVWDQPFVENMMKTIATRLKIR